MGEKSPALVPVPPQISIPDDLKGLVSLTPTSEYFFSRERDWRVAEDSLAFPSIGDNGKKMRNFTRGPDNHGLKVSSDLVLEKLVSGKTFLALTDRAVKWDQLALAFSHLRKPEQDSLFEAEKRTERRFIMDEVREDIQVPGSGRRREQKQAETEDLLR